MKKHLKLALIAFIAASIVACKKETTEETSVSKFKVPNKTSNIPGVIASGSPLVINSSTGNYHTNYSGEMIFNNISASTGSFLEGEQVANISIYNDGSYLDVETIGPYFVVIRPTFVGPIAPVRAQILAFRNAYNNFITDSVVNGAPLQPYLPSLDNYVTAGAGQFVIKGQVVRTHSTPSTYTVVASSFIPTPPAAPATPSILGFFIDAGNTYYVYGTGLSSSGNITSVKAYDSNNDPFNVLSFSGTFAAEGTGMSFVGYRLNLTIQKDYSTVINYIGLVNGD